MCTTNVSTWLVFPSGPDSWHLLHFALIICAGKQSPPSNDVPIQDFTNETIKFKRCLLPKFTVGYLVFTILFRR